MKTLYVTVNHNMRESTASLYKSLKPYERDDYDLHVIDNGSSPEEVSEFATIKLDQNVYYGGAFRCAVQLALDNRDKYDSLLFSVNTISLFGYNFVKSMRDYMFSNDNIGLVSPSVIAAGRVQNAWRHMHNWCSPEPRQVRWIDFQAPLIRTDLLSKIGDYPDFGIAYGYDLYTSIRAEELGYTAYVLDYVNVIHQQKETVKSGKAPFDQQAFGALALDGMWKGLQSVKLIDYANELRSWSNNYTPS